MGRGRGNVGFLVRQVLIGPFRPSSQARKAVKLDERRCLVAYGFETGVAHVRSYQPSRHSFQPSQGRT